MVITQAYHPWIYLLEEIETRGRTQSYFAQLLSIDKSELNNIIKWRRNITARIATRIWYVFNTSAEVRLQLQNMYDIYIVQTSTEHKFYVENLNKKENTFHPVH